MFYPNLNFLNKKKCVKYDLHKLVEKLNKQSNKKWLFLRFFSKWGNI